MQKNFTLKLFTYKDLIGLDLMTHQIFKVIYCQILFIHKYIKCLRKFIGNILNKPELIFLHPVKRFQIFLSRTNYNRYHRFFHVSRFFPTLELGPGTYQHFHFLSILFCGQPEQQSPQFGKFSFFVVDY